MLHTKLCIATKGITMDEETTTPVTDAPVPATTPSEPTTEEKKPEETEVTPAA